jgi:hypothetical protein
MRSHACARGGQRSESRAPRRSPSRRGRSRRSFRRSAATGAGSPRSPTHGWTIPAAVGLAAFALVHAWEAVRAARTRRRGVGLLALCAVYLVLAFKEGFVLQDEPHIEAYFGDALVVFALLPLRGWRRALPLAGITAGVLAFAAVAGGGDALRIVNPHANATAVADQVRVLASTAERERIRAGVRARIEHLYGVDPRLLSAIGRHTTMLWPYLYGEVAWAYGLNLRDHPLGRAGRCAGAAPPRRSAARACRGGDGAGA